jgi:two-component system sensor histidine kinase KdpD
VAALVSNVAARVRTQAVAAMARARTTEALYSFSRKLAGVATLDDVLWATTYQIALMLKVRVVILLPEHGTIAVKAGYPPEDRIDDADVAAAKWAWEKDRSAGRGSDTLPGAKRLFLPMRTGRGTIGVIGIDTDKPGALLTPDERRLLDALSDQSAIAIERVHLVADMDRVKRTVETDRLRSALLTSISHDLKTPLAAILGAGGAMRDLAKALTDAQKAELVGTIIDESERLNRFIANLLDMTKLESGAVVPNAALHDVGEVVGSAIERASKMLGHHRIEVDLADDLPMVDIDPVLFEQVLFNLLDNAAKYAQSARCWTRARGSRRAISSTSSTSSIGRAKPIRCAQEPASGWRFPAASSRQCTGRSRRRTDPIAAGRSSPSGCRFRRPLSHWTLPHERCAGPGSDRRRRAAHPQASADGPDRPRLSRAGGAGRSNGAQSDRGKTRSGHSRSRTSGYAGPRPATDDTRTQRAGPDRGAFESRR